MKEFPKISIVTPTFNQGQYIEQTIQSVLDQKYPNLQYIIIDGGSTDNTVQLIQKYEKHLSFWISEKDRGQSHAINKGLEKSTGDIFNWINSDDYYDGNVFEKVANAFSKDGTHMFAGKSHVFGGDKEWISNGTKLPDEKSNLIVHPSIDQPATFFSMEAVRQLGPLTEELHYTMDLEWLLKFWFLFGTNAIVKTDDVLVHFREHPGSKTVNFQQRFTDDRIKIYQSILSQLDFGVPLVRDYQFPLLNKAKISPDFIAKVSNRFIFLEMQVAYGDKDYKRFLELYKLLIIRFLKSDELRMVNKQKKRSSILKYFSQKNK